MEAQDAGLATAQDSGVGILVYDIPMSKNGLRGKLLNKISRWAIPMTQSCYLIRWGMRDTALKILKEMDGPSPSDRIRYSCLKFDASGQEELDVIARSSLKRITKEIEDYVYTRVSKALIMFDDGKYDKAECRQAQRIALARAKSKAKKARWLSVIFEISDSVNTALDSIDAYVNKKREEIRLEIKNEIEKASLTPHIVGGQ